MFNHSCRIFHRHGIIGHILRYNRCRSHNGILAHGDPRQDGASGSNPRSLANADRAACDDVAIVWVVVVADELHVGCDACVVLNGYGACRHHKAAVHHHRALAYAHGIGTHHGNGRHDERFLAYMVLNNSRCRLHHSSLNGSDWLNLCTSWA